MATREISVVLRAKNMLAAGLSSAGSSLKSFGSALWNVGKMAAVAFTGAATAVAGFAAKALSAYAEQEKATNAMASSFRSYGEEVAVNTEKVKNFAAAIQDETGADDDALVARAARLKLLGVETSKLEEATKGTLALAAAGMDGDAATKAMAGAMAGNYSMLTRYIPALKEATTQEEKAAILKDFLAKGYQQQKDALNTVAGSWAALKGRVGELWEEVGNAISQNDSLTKSILSAGEAVKAFTARVAEWVAGGGVVNMISAMKMFYEDASYRFMMLSNSANLYFASIGDYWTFQLRWMNAQFSAYIETIKAGYSLIVDWAKYSAKSVVMPWSNLEPPDTSRVKNALADLLASFKATNFIQSQNTKEALDYRVKLEMDHLAKMKELSEEQLRNLQKNAVKQAAISATTAAAIIGIESEGAGEVADIKAAAADESEAALSEKVVAEVEAMTRVVGANATAAEEVTGIWNGSLSAFADIEAQKVALASASAKEIADINASTSLGSGSGTIETSSKYKTAKMKAAGLDPTMANGSVLTSQQSKALDSVTQEQILAELKKMNQNQERLLSFG